MNENQPIENDQAIDYKTLEEHEVIEVNVRQEGPETQPFRFGKCVDNKGDEKECVQVDKKWHLTSDLKEWFMTRWRDNNSPTFPHNGVAASDQLLKRLGSTKQDYIKNQLEGKIDRAKTDAEFQELLFEVTAQDSADRDNYLPKVIDRIADEKGKTILKILRYNSQ